MMLSRLRGILNAAKDTGAIYLGGQFTNVSSMTRNRAAAVSMGGTLESWNPNVGDNIVYTMVLSGSNLYLGGTFASVQGTARNRVACVDATVTVAAPTLRPWNPNCSTAGVMVMVLSGSNMYLGGGFTTIRGTPRNRAACVDSDVTAANPTLRAWNPDCSGPVYSMVLSGSDMYLGGAFNVVRNALLRYSAACVEATVTAAEPAVRPWHPNCPMNTWGVTSMILSGSNMYLCGDFTSVRSQPRNGAACVDATVTVADPTLRPWNPNCNQTVHTMVLSGSNMYLGGHFTSVRSQPRNRAACVDATVTVADPTLRPWNPNCQSSVYSMVLSGSDLYLGGLFRSVRSETRNYAACVDATVTVADPTLRPWNPNCNNSVWEMLIA